MRADLSQPDQDPVTVEADHRLPRTVEPSHYRLTLEPDLDAFAFAGREVVEVAVHEPVDEITLNAAELEIDHVELVSVGSAERIGASVSYDAVAERATFELERTASPGAWELHVEFTGVLNDRLRGFYRSSYTDADGAPQVIATTQFEATDARRAFPCWDEPDLKATFGVTLIVPDGMAAISNGPEISSEAAGEGKRRVTFADTMRMSTYLVAFIVGRLEATDPIDAGGVPVRVVHPPGREHLTGFALEAAAHALEYFADYYGIAYPGDKLDMIAIPDFAWGAMENLGAVTYRETALLVDPATATRAELERVASVIAHELAHMWFGDLVTMKWWNGIWLNEAFATFMEMKCTDAFRPDWKVWLGFGADRSHAMEIDSLSHTRPVEFPVASPEEANAMFDTLTYEKGSSVLRMLEQYLGEETFRRGIASYLAAHAYANTDTDDLWAALETASGQPVRDMMHSWIYQGGFPQVHVARSPEGYHLAQEQFRYLGDGQASWQIPVLYRSDAGSGRVIVDGPATIEAADGLLVNAGGAGFYRSRYAPDLLEGLRERIGTLDPHERYAVVSDTWANVLAGNSPAAEFVEFIAGLTNESEPSVWGAALSGLTELDRIASSDDRPALRRFVETLVADAADRLGWQPAAGETDLTKSLRGLLLRARGNLADHQPTRSEAQAVFEQAVADPGSIDGDVASAALAIVAANGGRPEYERFLELSDAAASPQDKVRYLRAAASVPDASCGADLLSRVIEGKVRSQDAMWVVAVLIGQRDVGAATWAQVREQWDAVLAALPPQNARRILDSVQYRSEPDVATDIEHWLTTHPLQGAEQHVAQQLERLQVRVRLRDREAARLSAAFGA